MLRTLRPAGCPGTPALGRARKAPIATGRLDPEGSARCDRSVIPALEAIPAEVKQRIPCRFGF